MRTARRMLGWSLLAVLLLWFGASTALATPAHQDGPPQAPPPPSGPYYHQVYLAFSQDGLRWQVAEETVRDHTSMPDAIYWQETLWIYAVDGAEHGLIVLRQKADGSWEEQRVQIEGFDASVAVDPDVIALPDGRLRLYYLDFSALQPKPGAPAQATIYSAVSADGVHFTQEEGYRFRADDLITDPDVVQVGEQWWMYVLAGPKLLVAQSSDGLNFTPVAELTDAGLSGTFALADGTLRQFYCTAGGTFAHDSSDGLNWGQATLVLPELCGSSALQLPDGSWVVPAVRVDMPQQAPPPPNEHGGQPAQQLGMAPQDGQPAGPGAPTPNGPQGQGAPPQQGGPYFHQVHLARSDDGLHWETLGMVRDHASVPELVRWQGTLWIYAVDGVEHGLIVLRQGADGSWEEQRVQIEGFDASSAVDPDVTVLPDGRLRLYYLDFSTLQAAQGAPVQATIYSAVSEDGVHFTPEEGHRFRTDGMATDPDVVQFGDVWWMYISQGTRLIIARSTDGLSFEAVGASENGGVSNTVLLDDGTLRQYACREGIFSQRSPDGLSWTIETGTQVPNACDPSVIREADSAWLMAYKTFAQP